eukprot:g2336.t1
MGKENRDDGKTKTERSKRRSAVSVHVPHVGCSGTPICCAWESKELVLMRKDADDESDDFRRTSAMFTCSIDAAYVDTSSEKGCVLVADTSCRLHVLNFEGAVVHSQQLPKSRGRFVSIHAWESELMILTDSGIVFMFNGPNLSTLVRNDLKGADSRELLKRMKSSTKMKILNCCDDEKEDTKTAHWQLVSSSDHVALVKCAASSTDVVEHAKETEKIAYVKTWSSSHQRFVPIDAKSYPETFRSVCEAAWSMDSKESSTLLVLFDGLQSTSTIACVALEGQHAKMWTVPYTATFTCLAKDPCTQSIRIASVYKHESTSEAETELRVISLNASDADNEWSTQYRLPFDGPPLLASSGLDESFFTIVGQNAIDAENGKDAKCGTCLLRFWHDKPNDKGSTKVDSGVTSSDLEASENVSPWNELFTKSRNVLANMPLGLASSSRGLRTYLDEKTDLATVAACCVLATLDDFDSTIAVLDYALSRIENSKDEQVATYRIETDELQHFVRRTQRRLITFMRMSATLGGKYRVWSSDRWHRFRSTEITDALELLLRQGKFAAAAVVWRRHCETDDGDRIYDLVKSGKMLRQIPLASDTWDEEEGAEWDTLLVWLKEELAPRFAFDAVAMRTLSMWLVDRCVRIARSHSSANFAFRLASTFASNVDSAGLGPLSSKGSLVRSASLLAADKIEHAVSAFSEVSDAGDDAPLFSLRRLREMLVEMIHLRKERNLSIAFDDIWQRTPTQIAMLLLENEAYASYDDCLQNHVAVYCKRMDLSLDEVLRAYIRRVCQSSTSAASSPGRRQVVDKALSPEKETKLIKCVYAASRRADAAILLLRRSRPPYTFAIRELMNDALVWAESCGDELRRDEIREQKRLMDIDTVLMTYCTPLAAASFNFVDVSQARQLLHHILAQVPTATRKMKDVKAALKPLDDGLVIVGGYATLKTRDVFAEFLAHAIMPHHDAPMESSDLCALVHAALDQTLASKPLEGLDVARQTVRFCADVLCDFEVTSCIGLWDVRSVPKSNVRAATDAGIACIRWAKRVVLRMEQDQRRGAEVSLKVNERALGEWTSWTVDEGSSLLENLLTARRLQLEFGEYLSPRSLQTPVELQKILTRRLEEALDASSDRTAMLSAAKTAELFRLAKLLLGDTYCSATYLRGVISVACARRGLTTEASSWASELWTQVHPTSETSAADALVETSIEMLRHAIDDSKSADISDRVADQLSRATAICDASRLDRTIEMWQRSDLARAVFKHTEMGDFGKMLWDAAATSSTPSLDTPFRACDVHIAWQRDDNIVLPGAPAMKRALKFALDAGGPFDDDSNAEVELQEDKGRSSESTMTATDALSLWLRDQSAELLATRTHLMLLRPSNVTVLLKKAMRSARVDTDLCFSYLLLLDRDDIGASLYRRAVRDCYEMISRGGKFGGAVGGKKKRTRAVGGAEAIGSRIEPQKQQQLFARLLRLGRTGMEAAHACGQFDLLREAAAVEANAHWWSRLCDLGILFDICQFPDPLFGVQADPPVSPSVSSPPAVCRAYLETLIPLFLDATALNIEETLYFSRQYGVDDEISLRIYLRKLILSREDDSTATRGGVESDVPRSVDHNGAVDIETSRRRRGACAPKCVYHKTFLGDELDIRKRAFAVARQIPRDALVKLLFEVEKSVGGTMHTRLRLVVTLLLNALSRDDEDDEETDALCRRSKSREKNMATTDILREHNALKRLQRMGEVLDVLLTFAKSFDAPIDARVLLRSPWSAIDPALSVSSLRYLIALAAPLRLNPDQFVVRLLKKSFRHPRYERGSEETSSATKLGMVTCGELPPPSFLRDQLKGIRNPSEAVKISEWVADQYPFVWSGSVTRDSDIESTAVESSNATSGKERLEALSIAFESAVRWEQKARDSGTKSDANRAKIRLLVRRRHLAIQMALATLKPQAMPIVLELKPFWTEPEQLICRLYHRMGHISDRCGDLHRVVDAIASSCNDVVDASRVRKFLVRHWLQRGNVIPLLRNDDEVAEDEEADAVVGNDEDDLASDFDASMSVFARTSEEKELSEEREIVDRICYVLRVGGPDAVRQRCHLLLEFALRKNVRSPSSEKLSSDLEKAGSFRSKCRALRSVVSLVRPDDLHELIVSSTRTIGVEGGRMKTAEDLAEFWKCCELMTRFETLRLPLSMSQFVSCDKLGLVRGLWRKLASLDPEQDEVSALRARRLARLFLQLMIDFEIPDVQLWVALLRKARRLKMHRDLFVALDSMSSFSFLTGPLSRTGGDNDDLLMQQLKLVWTDILMQPLRELERESQTGLESRLSCSAVRDVLCLVPLRLSQCPHLDSLDGHEIARSVRSFGDSWSHFARKCERYVPLRGSEK